MGQLIKFILLSITTFSVQVSKAGQNEHVEKTTFHFIYYNYQNDTTFYGNYIAASKKAYLYSKPNLISKTKTKFPQKVWLNVTKKSGDFVYGEFNISSTESFKGWFRLSDLKAISFTAPKTNK